MKRSKDRGSSEAVKEWVLAERAKLVDACASTPSVALARDSSPIEGERGAFSLLSSPVQHSEALASPRWGGAREAGGGVRPTVLEERAQEAGPILSQALKTRGSLFAVFALASCTQPAQVAPPDSVEAVAAAEVPADVAAAAQAALPGFTIVEAERKERDGRVYYDVEGTRVDGAEAELDLLQTAQGWRVVEIQRDIAWADAPANVRAAAQAAPNAFEPVRVIESTQAEGGAVIYELFAEGRPEAPSMEVRLASGSAEIMTTANPH